MARPYECYAALFVVTLTAYHTRSLSIVDVTVTPNNTGRTPYIPHHIEETGARCHEYARMVIIGEDGLVYAENITMDIELVDEAIVMAMATEGNVVTQSRYHCCYGVRRDMLQLHNTR